MGMYDIVLSSIRLHCIPHTLDVAGIFQSFVDIPIMHGCGHILSTCAHGGDQETVYMKGSRFT